MLDEFEAFNVEISNSLISNLIQENLVDEIKYISIEDIVESQNGGELIFSISDESFDDKKLHAIDVDYKDEFNYSWTGTAIDDSFTATFIKDRNGFSGRLYNFDSNEIYLIYPVANTNSALIKLEQFAPHSCGTTPTTLSEINGEVCDEPCAGHIDILFLLDSNMQNWIANQSFTDTYLNILINELNTAFATSGITHTIDYTWAGTNWMWNRPNDIVDDCRNEIKDFSLDPEVNALKNLHNADIVVALRADDPWVSAIEGCVPEDFLELNADGAFLILEAQSTLRKPTFSHEIGHLLGGQHIYKFVPSIDNNTLPFCPWAHLIFSNSSLNNPIRYTTIMDGVTGTTLHFSDPDNTFKGFPTGEKGDPDATSFTPASNNTARLNATGCIVGGFNDSPNIQGTIEINLNDCKLNLESIINPKNALYEYEWFWSFDGLFINQFPGISLGSGDVLIVDEPINDPCENYFIQMVVYLNGEIVDVEVVNQKGGICTDNVQCNNPPLQLKIENDSEVVNEDELTENSESDLNIKYVVDISGRVIFVNSEKLNETEIHDLISTLYTGVYFMVCSEKNNLQVLKKRFSLKNN